MPDAHSEYVMSIGGVMAAYGVIVPNAVGVGYRLRHVCS